MKYINKFIAIGLGFALMFTGTNFVHGWFTSSATQNNVVTIQKKFIEVLVEQKGYFFGKESGRFNLLYIPINVTGDVSINDLNIYAQLTDNNNNGSTSFKYSIGDGVNKSLKYLILEEQSGVEFGTKSNLTLDLSISTKYTGYELLEQSYTIIKTDNGNTNVQGYGKVQYVDLELLSTSNKELYKSENNDNIEDLNPEILDTPNEEVENPGDQEVIELPNEEVENPGEPEVIEPLNETEGLQE